MDITCRLSCIEECICTFNIQQHYSVLYVQFKSWSVPTCGVRKEQEKKELLNGRCGIRTRAPLFRPRNKPAV